MAFCRLWAKRAAAHKFFFKNTRQSATHANLAICLEVGPDAGPVYILSKHHENAATQRDQMTDLEAIKKILWEDWDPIGVREIEGPSDEYDAYAPTVLQMLDAGASRTEIARYLYWLTVEQMGLETFELRVARTIEKLKAP